MPQSASVTPSLDVDVPDIPIHRQTGFQVLLRFFHMEAAVIVHDPDHGKSAYRKTVFSPVQYHMSPAPFSYIAVDPVQKTDHYADVRIPESFLLPKRHFYKHPIQIGCLKSRNPYKPHFSSQVPAMLYLHSDNRNLPLSS